jgi:hypothetical protein
LVEQPPALYREATSDQPSDLQAIASCKFLELVDNRLEQIEALQLLFCTQLPFQFPVTTEDSADQPSLSALFLTAVANQLLGRPFTPAPLPPEDLLLLRAQTLPEQQLAPEFIASIHELIQQLSDKCGFFIDFCLNCWQEDLQRVDPAKLDSTFPVCLLISN